jgi:hypothetical protein
MPVKELESTIFRTAVIFSPYYKLNYTTYPALQQAPTMVLFSSPCLVKYNKKTDKGKGARHHFEQNQKKAAPTDGFLKIPNRLFSCGTLSLLF